MIKILQKKEKSYGMVKTVNQGFIRLDPGDCKEVSKENAEEKEPFLSGGNIYPAGIVE